MSPYPFFMSTFYFHIQRVLFVYLVAIIGVVIGSWVLTPMAYAASVTGADNYWDPSMGNYYNDHYAVPTTTNTTLYSFSWDFQTADNQPLSGGGPRSPVPLPLVGGVPYAILVYYCNGIPPVFPAVFPNTGVCPSGGMGYLGSRNTISGSITFGTPKVLRDSLGNNYYVLVRFLYYNFDTTAQIWQQELLSATNGVNPRGVRTILTWNFGANIDTTDVRQRFGFCGDGRVSGPETCDAGVGGVPTASATCTLSCQAPSTPGGGGGTGPGGGGGGGSGGGGGGGGGGSGGGGSGGGTSTPTSTPVSTPSTGNPCTFVYANGQPANAVIGDPSSIKVPIVTPVLRASATFGERYVVPLQLVRTGVDAADSACFDPAQLCVRVRADSIVAQYRHDIQGQPWGSCLNLTDPTISPRYEFDPVQGMLYLPAQDKQSYEVVGSVVAGGTHTLLGKSAFFDTRIRYIRIIGPARGLAHLTPAEAKNYMSPNIKQILQPFESGSIVTPVCDARHGVKLHSLDYLATYIEYDAAGRPTTRNLSRCFAPGSRDVIYFDPPYGGHVLLDAEGDDFVLPKTPVTLVVKGADVRIMDNLKYPVNEPKASLGMIVLKNNSYGGNIYLNPKPTDVQAMVYVEGSVQAAVPVSSSPVARWNIPQLSGIERDSAEWYATFKNQIYWQGTILSQNSVEGSVDPTWTYYGDPKCPTLGGLSSCPWRSAVDLDLAYMREFYFCENHSDLTRYGGFNVENCTTHSEMVRDEIGTIRGGTPYPEAVVIKYDGRLQSNPPPGFENFGKIIQKEIGL